MSTPLVIVRAVQTCTACPSQWDAWTADGQYLYLRYRGSRGTVDTYADPNSETWTTVPDGKLARFGKGFEITKWDKEISLDGEIGLEEFCQRAGIRLALEDAEDSS